jgi:alkanesulfonate monooxygenase SsuD/methylene tetrahydromethanopterin reductase-like flavin-dependent oxidoreductase (luciferase family)
MGANPDEFSAVGRTPEERAVMVAETFAVLRAAWTGAPIHFQGAGISTHGVTVNPTPVRRIPLIYGGSTPAAVRRAATLADGWLCGRLPLATFDARMRLFREVASGASPEILTQPLIVIAPSKKDALARLPPLASMTNTEGSRLWVRPASGRFRSLDDLEGFVIAGTPDDIVATLTKFQDRGVTEVILDLRLQFDEYEVAMEMLGREVLPALRSRKASADRPL